MFVGEGGELGWGGVGTGGGGGGGGGGAVTTILDLTALSGLKEMYTTIGRMWKPLCSVPLSLNSVKWSPSMGVATLHC